MIKLSPRIVLYYLDRYFAHLFLAIRTVTGYRVKCISKFVHHRMPDELTWYAGSLVKRFLERQDDEDEVEIALHRLDTALPPRPDLRGCVVDHAVTRLLRGLRQSQVETRVVDQDHSVQFRLAKEARQRKV